jgi:hypothetical protein
MQTKAIPLSSLLFYLSDRDQQRIWANGQLVPFTGDVEPDLMNDREAHAIALADPNLVVQVWSGGA